MIFAGFFSELARQGANSRECGPEKRWFKSSLVGFGGGAVHLGRHDGRFGGRWRTMRRPTRGTSTPISRDIIALTPQASRAADMSRR